MKNGDNKGRSWPTQNLSHIVSINWCISSELRTSGLTTECEHVSNSGNPSIASDLEDVAKGFVHTHPVAKNAECPRKLRDNEWTTPCNIERNRDRNKAISTALCQR